MVVRPHRMDLETWRIVLNVEVNYCTNTPSISKQNEIGRSMDSKLSATHQTRHIPYTCKYSIPTRTYIHTIYYIPAHMRIRPERIQSDHTIMYTGPETYNLFQPQAEARCLTSCAINARANRPPENWFFDRTRARATNLLVSGFQLLLHIYMHRFVYNSAV